MSSSIFSKIIRGEIPSYKIYEDDNSFAFLDINPINPGHTLVVPKVEVDHIWDMELADYETLMSTVRNIAKNMRQKLDVGRIGILVEGFAVPHAHVHLIPINKGFELELSKPKTDQNTQEDLQKMADLLKM